jgi:hypothetical protein
MTTIRVMAQDFSCPQVRIGSVTRADNYTKFYIMMGVAAHYRAKAVTSQKYQLITGMICVVKCGIMGMRTSAKPKRDARQIMTLMKSCPVKF